MFLDFYNHRNHSQSGSRAWERRRPGGEWIGKRFAAKHAGAPGAVRISDFCFHFLIRRTPQVL
jgi:hypothetical protein